jgi:soluble lytic murein transglycosylase
MYEAALAADPGSYYAFRAGNRLGIHPVDRILAEPPPWVGLASDPGAADAALARLDALQRVGLEREWEQELASSLVVLRDRPAALLAVAEGLRDRNRPVEAIRLGRRLLELRNGEWDPRLLRVVFPFPYRELIEAEAADSDVDPMLLAGLIRQESTFRPAVRSWVGATGMSQIMPATGKWLASSLRIPDYEQRLLTVPEVNVRMGARYLGDQLRSYDGARDLALAAYNAGPGRASRWKRELGYGRDADAFREAIPFDETREYVKIVLRNAALYSRLYNDDRPVGLVPAHDR